MDGMPDLLDDRVGDSDAEPLPHDLNPRVPEKAAKITIKCKPLLTRTSCIPANFQS